MNSHELDKSDKHPPERNYFVMLEHPRGWPVPMMDSDNYDELAWFETAEQARIAGENNPLGDAYGYEIFERGGGQT